MTFFSALLISFFTLTTAFAQQDQKLSHGRWAYYGSEFYQVFGQKTHFNREILRKIFNGVHTSNPGQLDTISDSCGKGTCYKHESVGYDRARKIMFGELDIQKDLQGTYVVDVYCGKKFYFDSLNDVSNMHTKVNIEHTWPQSRFTKNFPKDIQKSDMHHLYLTDSQANSTRGNSPFGYIKEYEDRSGEGCKSSRHGLIDGSDFYTPPVAHRGNVARALFYFAMRYDLKISTSEEVTLRYWHKKDPVDAEEKRRHELIAKHQKVRNPFIDHPQLVEQISDF